MDRFDDDLLQRVFQDWAAAEPAGHDNATKKRKRPSADGLDVHRRWRMRQKAKAKELGEELQAKQMMHGVLQAENVVLQRKVHVLESVLAMREEKLSQLSVVKAQQQQQQQQQRRRRQQRGECETHAQPPSKPESCPAHLPIVQPCQKSQQGNQEQQLQVGLPDGEQALLPDPPAEGKELSLQNIPPVAMWDQRWIQRMKQVTPAEWRRLWLEFMRESSMFALGAEAHGYGSAAYDQLTQVVQTYFGVLDQITLLAPAVYYDSLYVNIATGKCPDIPPEGHWEAVAKAVANVADAPFSRPCPTHILEEEDGGKADSQEAPREVSLKQQVQDCLAALELFDAKMRSVLQERTQLATSIQSCLQRDGHSTSELLQGSMMAGVHLDNWATLLAANVEAEQNAHNCVSDYLCARVLSPLQLVKAVAASYPFIPDVTAIV
ncbi:hypothetical protein DUNSADRAFT_1486 [Dunaliella salina]|uniref:Uncharacterized protein n=1 Tax=Dunaliella salina TaxID=3046 RepID=A0ABQ7FXD6_DUNSA|nr:hypothetical protein DUNSADRAFT_1486 [Dunaliella salina]|eukprot:KAF5827026.1 hypothetical protein DUNSADRAFT_1486 [Dunaliella salina]